MDTGGDRRREALMIDDRPLTGMVTTRLCPMCGQHEVGFTTGDGVFHPLRPGTLVQVFDSRDTGSVLRSQGEPSGEAATPDEEEDRGAFRAWVPTSLRNHRKLRLKYGVMFRADISVERLSSALYQAAYLDKLGSLIEKEIYTPLPVILDRHFTAPHLATGSPRQIAETMLRELKEVQEPVSAVHDWLKTRDARVFGQDEAGAAPQNAPGGEGLSDEALAEELEALTLEDFLSLL
jgi:hypothetical protein